MSISRRAKANRWPSSGPSGSGKTSLLMVMAGLERATSGKVEVAGHDLSGLGRGRAGADARRRDRHRVPVVPSRADDDGAGERGAAAGVRRRRRRLRHGARAAAGSRPQPPHGSFPGAAFGRRAAARRHRARAEPPAEAHSRRRADRQSRPQDRRAGDRSVVRPAAAARGDAHPRHARREAGRPHASAPSAWPTGASKVETEALAS